MADEETWDERRARAMIGKTMLVGLAYLDHGGSRVEQFHGEVVSADPGRGVELRLGGLRSGETVILPPDLSNVFEAVPGSYTLRTTGEVVESPDFTATWDIRPPEDRSA